MIAFNRRRFGFLSGLAYLGWMNRHRIRSGISGIPGFRGRMGGTSNVETDYGTPSDRPGAELDKNLKKVV